MDVITTLRRSLERRREQVLFAYLFGSFAEGKEEPLSDVDVAVFLTDKFRNLLAHDYERIDSAVICGQVLARPSDFDLYLQQIETAIL